jgi:uncharacterized membrane protein (DUF2068 family)
MEHSNKLAVPVIYIKAVVALMFIQLVHKAVREIPHVLQMTRIFPKVGLIFFTALLIAGIIGVFRRLRWGLIFGMVGGSWMIFQPFLVHGIMRVPHLNGIWWYPIFPITQGGLIIYFSLLTLQKNKERITLT